MHLRGIWTEVAALNSQVVHISQVLLKAGFTVFYIRVLTSVLEGWML